MNIALELALVAGAIAHPTEAQALLDLAPRATILDPLLGAVWGAVAEIVEAGQLPTLERVQAELVRAGLAERIGPSMADLAKGGPLPQVQRAAAMVRAAADQRRFVGILEGGLQDLSHVDADHAASTMAAILDALLRSMGERGARRLDMAEGLRGTLARAEARARGEVPERFWPLGVEGLDGRWSPAAGELVILGAQSGHGKSAFSQWICSRFLLAEAQGALLRPQAGAVYIPLADLDGAALADRELARLAPWAAWDVSRQVPSDWAIKRFRATVERDAPRLAGRMVVLEDTPREVEEVAQHIRRERLRMHAQGVQLQVAVVDYAQTLRCVGHEKMNQIEVLERVAQVLKDLAKALGVCVVLPSQLNRNRKGARGQRPTTDDIFGGSSLEHYADVVLLMHPTALPLRKDAAPHEKALRRLELLCCKYRHGPTFDLPLIADLSTYRYWPEATCPTTIYNPPPPKTARGEEEDDDALL